MKLSTRGRYGIHAMYDLACTRRSAAVDQGHRRARADPEAYLEQLIGPLRRAGLVRSVRGAQGGYLPAAPPEEITVGQVMRALEGELTLVDCLWGGRLRQELLVRHPHRLAAPQRWV